MKNPRIQEVAWQGAAENDLDVINRYSEINEVALWNQFADFGLLEYEKRPIEKYLTSDMRVLDIGCGCGREAISLGSRGMEVCCLDISPRMVRETLNRASKHNISLEAKVRNFREEIPFPGKFDAALLLEQVYHHIVQKEDRVASLNKVRETLIPEGLLLLSAFNEGDIDLFARWKWIRETNWQLPVRMALNDDNPFDARYCPSLTSTEKKKGLGSTGDRLSVIRWTIGYFRWLLVRKYRLRFRNYRTSGEHETPPNTKYVIRTQPGAQSERGFHFAVLSFSDIEDEFGKAGFQIIEVFGFLEPETGFSTRAKHGSPIVLVVAKRK